MATTKKTAAKKAAKKVATPRAKKITLADNVLWAVVKKSWFGGGVVKELHQSRAAAENSAEWLEVTENGTYVVQRAELRV